MYKHTLWYLYNDNITWWQIPQELNQSMIVWVNTYIFSNQFHFWLMTSWHKYRSNTFQMQCVNMSASIYIVSYWPVYAHTYTNSWSFSKFFWVVLILTCCCLCREGCRGNYPEEGSCLCTSHAPGGHLWVSLSREVTWYLFSHVVICLRCGWAHPLATRRQSVLAVRLEEATLALGFLGSKPTAGGERGRKTSCVGRASVIGPGLQSGKGQSTQWTSQSHLVSSTQR